MIELNRPPICPSFEVTNDEQVVGSSNRSPNIPLLEINNGEQMVESNRPVICSSLEINNYATKLRTLQAAIDHYRTLYLAERRTKFKLKAENIRLTSEISKYRRKVESLEKIVAKTK